ncbi:hypothetical protein AAHE18_07G061800 [Arachis hypogaea]
MLSCRKIYLTNFCQAVKAEQERAKGEEMLVTFDAFSKRLTIPSEREERHQHDPINSKILNLKLQNEANRPVCKMERFSPPKLIKARSKIIIFVNLKNMHSYDILSANNQIN